MLAATVYAASLIGIACLQLWLLSPHDVVVPTGRYDDLLFLELGAHWFWGRPYDLYSLVRLPVYPLWTSLVHLSGLPLFQASEALLLASYLFFVSSLRRAGIPRWLAVGIFALLALHPMTLEVLQRAVPAPVYASLLILVLSCTTRVLVARSDRARLAGALLLGIPFALLWYTRKEGIVLLGLIGIFAVLTALCARRDPDGRRSWWRPAAIATLPAAVWVLALYVAISFMNYRTFGASIVSASTAPGFRAAYHALLEIEPDRPIAYVSVTRDMRMKAYAASPVFRKLRPYLEGDLGGEWARFGQSLHAVPEGEVGTGWFLWLLRDALAHAYPIENAARAEALFAELAAEIEAAFEAGTLERRKTLFDFFNPDRSTFERLPDACRRIAAHLTQPGFEDRFEIEGKDPRIRLFVDRFANRRTPHSPTPGRQQMIGGRSDREIAGVRATGGDGRPLGVTFIRTESLDSGDPEASGFLVELPLPAGEREGLRLEWIDAEGHRFPMALADVAPGALAVASIGGDLELTLDVDALSKRDQPERVPGAILTAQRRVADLYGTLLGVGSWAALPMLLVLGFCWRQALAQRELWAVWLLIASCVWLRALLFALVDAYSHAGTETRYLFPVAALHAVSLLLLAYLTLTAARERLRPWVPRAGHRARPAGPASP